jgi:elongation factor 1-gamma
MTKGKLYAQAQNFRTQKVLTAAKFANKDVDVVTSAPPADKFPFGVAPAFEDGQTLLFGDETIAHYLLGDKLKAKNVEVGQWVEWGSGSLQRNVLAYVLPSVSAVEVDQATLNNAKTELFAQLEVFNKFLLSRTFLDGERLSWADVSVAFSLLPAFQHVLGEAERKKFVNVTRWFNTVVHQENVKAIVGALELPAKASTFDAAKFKELSAKTQQQSKKQEQPKKEQKQPEPKKEKPKKKDEDEDEADEPAALEPKFVDPFAAMPAGTLNMDNWKRVYSNEDTATKAIPWFWENFDPEHYSIWYGEYKYPTELAKVFMSCNLITGMFQRLDKMRKHAFGSVCLFGEDNNSTISGVWVWRGHELAFPLSPDWTVDYESYDWKKLDPKDEKVKKLVNEYLLWEGDFGGKKFNQGKIFK